MHLDFVRAQASSIVIKLHIWMVGQQGHWDGGVGDVFGDHEGGEALAEENAKIGWRKLELQQARSALRLLPQILEVVTGSDGTADERLAQVREMLMAGSGKLLLKETTG